MAAGAGLALVASLLAIYAFDVTAPWMVVLSLATTVPLALAVFFAMRARRAGREIGAALDEAWLKVASDLARSRGFADGGQIARTMRLDEDAAQRLAARLSVLELLQSPGNDDAWLRTELSFPPRVRIGDSEPMDETRERDELGTTRQRS